MANRDVLSRHYWRDRLAGFDGGAYWGTSLPGTQAEKGQEAIHTRKAPAGVSRDLEQLAPSGRAKQIVLLSALGILLHKWCSTKEVVLYTPVNSGPGDPGDGGNVIPVRISKFTDISFQQLVTGLKDALVEDLRHGGYPIGKIISGSNGLMKAQPATGMLLEEIQEAGAFDQLPPVVLFSFAVTDGLSLTIRYNNTAFDGDYAAILADTFFHLLQVLLRRRNDRLEGIGIFSEQDRLLLEVFNNTRTFYPQEQTITSFFEKQAAITPDNIAIKFMDKVMTYRELGSLCGRIACYLRERTALKAGGLVGVLLEREEYLIAVIFGILKAGGVYVPVDPGYPEERIHTILNESKVSIVITRSRFLPAQPLSPVVVNLDESLDEIRQQQVSVSCEEQLHKEVNGSSPAYIIHTSGSTGKPKGVVIDHHSVVNRILWMQRAFPLDEKDVLLQKTPLVFDVSIWELFWWSFTGACLCMLPPQDEKYPEKLVSCIEKYKVTTIHFVPSMLKTFLSFVKRTADHSRLGSLRLTFASGEALKPETVSLFAASLRSECGTRLINLYGPTEAAVDVSYYECDFAPHRTIIPIGRPIDNTGLYVLDSNLRLLPVGVTGELYIAGVGLARGYLNNIGLTAVKFIGSPDVPGRLYRTGDRARWAEDGNLEFFGRIDEQVKLRGFRIEPGEIESRLSEHEAVDDVVVTLRGMDEDQCLVAYYVAEERLPETELTQFLYTRLPAYMIPSHFVFLDRMPLTPNGKLNRALLPDPVIGIKEEETGPAGELEEHLAGLWAKVLGIDKSLIGANRSFFELGGNSLKIVQLNLLINDSLQCGISTPDLFTYPSISALATFIRSGNGRLESYRLEMAEDANDMLGAIELLNHL